MLLCFKQFVLRLKGVDNSVKAVLCMVNSTNFCHEKPSFISFTIAYLCKQLASVLIHRLFFKSFAYARDWFQSIT